jgi:hypothetical protein
LNFVSGSLSTTPLDGGKSETVEKGLEHVLKEAVAIYKDMYLNAETLAEAMRILDDARGALVKATIEYNAKNGARVDNLQKAILQQVANSEFPPRKF